MSLKIAPREEDNITKLIDTERIETSLLKSPKPAFIIVGKSGSGKTTLAKRLASQTGIELVNVETILANKANLLGAQESQNVINNELNAGREFTTNQILYIVNKAINNESLQFTGFVLDDLPSSNPQICKPKTAKPTSFRPISKSVKKKRPLTTPLPETDSLIEQKPNSAPPLELKAAVGQRESTPDHAALSPVEQLTELKLLERLTLQYAENPTCSRPASRRSTFVADFFPVLINLTITDSTLKRRRIGQRVDPLTNIVYTDQQIKATIKNSLLKKGLVEESESQIEGEDAEENGDDENQEEENEKPEEEGEKPDVLPEEDPYSKMNVESSEQTTHMDSKSKKKKSKEIKRIKLSNKMGLESIPDDVLQRLLRRREDFEDFVDQELDYWNQNVEPELKRMMLKSNKQSTNGRNFHYIEVDGSQHADVVFQDLLFQIENLKISTERVISPKILSPIDTRGKLDDDIMKAYCSVDLEADEPPREIGAWTKFCPVTFVIDKSLKLANLVFSVAYKGQVYFFASEGRMEQFIINPDYYLSCPTQIPGLTICVLGGPFSGKTTQGKLLAKIYDLRYFNLSEVLSTWDKDPDQISLTGRPITSALMIETIKYFLDNEKLDIDDENYSKSWLLDGFPRTKEESNAMIEAGLIPKYTIVLQNDINDVAIRDRPDTLRASSQTGKLINPLSVQISQSRHEKTGKRYKNDWMPELDIAMYPFFDNLFNGYKEEFLETLKALEENNVQVISVQAEIAIHTILSILQTAIDPFLPQANMLSSEKISQLPPSFEMGYTKNYCPVTLRKKNIIVKGNPQCAAEYRGKIYNFINDDAKNIFCAEPHNFVSSNVAKNPPPPIRLLIVGPRGAGKTSCAKALSVENKVPFVDFEKHFEDFVSNLGESEQNDVAESIQQTGTPTIGVIQSAFASLFKGEYANSGFILENFPRNKSEADFFIRDGLYVDAVISLKTEPGVLGNRLHKKLLKETAKQQLSIPDDPNSDPNAKLNEFVDQIEKQVSTIQDVLSAIENSPALIPIIEVDASRYLRPIMAEIQDKTKLIVQNRNGIFANTFLIGSTTATSLLKYGIKKKYCPVTLKNNKSVLRSALGRYPAVFDEHVYFMKSEKERKLFIENPYNYAKDPCPQPAVQPTVCVLGAPKSGKTVLAERISREFDLVYLTVPIVLQAILDGSEESVLHDTIKHELESGSVVSDENVTEAICLITNRGVCKGKGWVLDGYPYTEKQALLLENSGVSPKNFIQLNSDEETIRKRCLEAFRSDTLSNLPDINVLDVINLRNDVFNESINQINDIFSTKYFSWDTIDLGLSKWAVSNTAHIAIENSILLRQQYLDLKTKGRAAPIWKRVSNKKSTAESTSCFQNYCVVSLKDKQELECSSNNYLAEYKDVFYTLSSQAALDTFLENPERYISQELPSLPERIQESELKYLFPKEIQLMGYCPVTIATGPQGLESIVHGSKQCIVKYKDNLYAMVDESKVEKFLRTPWKFINLTLPKVLPPVKVSVPISSLPMVGYLELTIQAKLNEALQELGKVKPKYPFKSLHESACNFLAVYLKANNPSSKEWTRKKYANNLNLFKDDCELITYLSQVMEKRAYIPDYDFEPGFEKKLEHFLSLKERAK